MLQSVDNYVNEQQPPSRGVNPENCYNTILGTNRFEESRTLFTKVILERHDFKCRIGRDKICLTFVNSRMFYNDKNIVRDFAPVFVVAKNFGTLFTEQLTNDAKNAIQSLLYTNNVLIPLHIRDGRVTPYGMACGVRNHYQTPIGGKIDMGRIGGEYLYYYGNIFRYHWSVRNVSLLNSVVDIDIRSVGESIVDETSVKHSLL